MVDDVRRLLEFGRFAEALAAFRAQPTPTRPNHAERLLQAELLEKTGKPQEAKRVAGAVAHDERAEPCLRGQALTLLGNLALEEGRPFDAVQLLRSAIAEAEKGACLNAVCWAELRLLIALFEASPADAAASFLSTVRRHVYQLGDPKVTAALHLFVAEVEAKRGAVGTSARHVRVARSVLECVENQWLQGMVAIAEFCVAFISSDLDAACGFANEALATVDESGHARTKLASFINLAHTHLKRGELNEAERRFADAWRLCDLSPRCREYLLEGMAQLALARGQLDESVSFLERLDGYPSSKLSYPKAWSALTRARLFGRLTQWSDAESIVSEALSAPSIAADRQLSSLLRLLRVEALALQGDFDQASRDILAAFGGADEPPLEVLAEAHRVTGRALALEGDAAGAEVACRHGARVFRAIGHLRAAEEVQAQAAQLPAMALPAGLPPLGPTTGTSLSKAASPVASRPDLVLRHVSALVDHAARPDLLGPAVLDLAMAVGCASSVAVVSVGPHGDHRLEHVTGWTAKEAAAADAAPDPPPLPLGSWRDREWHLVAHVNPTVADRSAWLAVHRLARAGVALAAARREEREREALWPIDNPDTPSPGVFVSEQMRDRLRLARRLAGTNVLVLITGETGAGKEVFARVLHDSSPRASKPFVPFNCSAVPREMLESQLFGYRRGAFTGAQDAFPGVIRAAAGGTLFLDEIGEMGLDVQPKLLRFLESGEVHPLGEPHPVRVDVRVVCATNRDLDALVRDGRFREDLYYRINVVHLDVPPLRERREEIPAIVEHYLERFAREHHKGRLRLADETMEYLVLYGWPGNVRQLMNEMRRLAALAETDAVLMPEHLDRRITAARRTRPVAERELLPTELVVRLDQPLAAAVEHLERAMIQQALAACHGRVEQVARRLGLSRKGLYLKRQRLGIDQA
jgi:DNA-binding NtrC family response regulator/tetratricopeptide (TPR) repeat protein